MVKDSNVSDAFDFTVGDSISIEAWVFVEAIGRGHNTYVISKGRTGGPLSSPDNQNWGLRIAERSGKHQLSFLFATERAIGQKGDSHWHRWTTLAGLPNSQRWNHIAVSYQFGNPSSIRGWINAIEQPGVWDMGGPTDKPPVVDNDDVWIGSSTRGSSSSSFRGSIDDVILRRRGLTTDELESRVELVEPDPGPPAMSSSSDAVHVMVDGSILSHEHFPMSYAWSPSPMRSDVPPFKTDAFLFPRLPRPHDEHGIRESWSAPVWLAASANVDFPKGTAKLLVRARGLTRLWVDHQLIATLGKHLGSTDGHNPVEPLPLPPIPGIASVGYGLTESIGEVTFDRPTTAKVVFETIVGGQAYRAETGRTMVGVQMPGDADYRLLRPGTGVQDEPPMSTLHVDLRATESEAQFERFDAATRRALAKTHDPFWDRRHAAARAVVSN